MDMYSQVMKQLQELLYCRHVYLTNRCNHSIEIALKYAKNAGFLRVLIPDQGGWMKYEPIAKKLNFEVVFIPTTLGVIDPDFLQQFLRPQDVVLLHSLAGYHTIQPSEAIAKVCKVHSALFIEDVCGTISRQTYGDIVVCSFGHAKPVNLGTGGCIATNNTTITEFFEKEAIGFDESFLVRLSQALSGVKKRLAFLYSIREKLRSEFSGAIADANGLVLIVPYQTEQQANEIRALCVKNAVEYTECPRYIRANIQAISVEIKRISEKEE